MFKLRQIAALAIVAGCVAASGASAKAVWPKSIVGTWNGTSNQTSIVLTVSTQTAGGDCQSISGTMQNVVEGDVTNILGYYCPDSGAVEFVRLPTNSSAAFQVYTASVNQAHAKAPQAMIAGSFGQYDPSYGPLGQYSFSVFQ